MASNKRRALPPDECAVFCEQAALVLKSGLPLADSIDAVTDGYKNTRYAREMDALGEEIKLTGSFYQAVLKADILPKYAVGMIRIGEAAGTLERVMESLNVYYEREANIRASIKNAIIYPAALVIMMAVVVGVLIDRVLPIFEQVFRNLGSDMGESMTAVMNFGLSAGRIALIFAGVVVTGTLIVCLMMKTRFSGGARAFAFKLLPPLRRVTERATAARLSMVFSMLLGAGFPLDEAARLAPDVTEDKDTRERVEKMRDMMEAGAPFAEALEKTGVFRPVHIKMIQAGAMAGQTDRVMQRLGEVYEQETDEGISRLVALIEPTLVGLISIVIGGILLAVMLPLASILASMG